MAILIRCHLSRTQSVGVFIIYTTMKYQVIFWAKT